MKIGEVKEIDLNTLAFLQSNKDEAIKEFTKSLNDNISLSDRVDKLINTLLKT